MGIWDTVLGSPDTKVDYYRQLTEELGSPDPQRDYYQQLAKVHQANHIILHGTRVPNPVQFYREVQNGETFFAEAIGVFVNGYANAAAVIAFKCLDIGLKKKYETQEKQLPVDERGWHMSAHKLLEYFEDDLREKKYLAQHAKELRNKAAHSEELVDLNEAAHVIDHVAECLNELFPRENSGVLQGYCQNCHRFYSFPIANDYNLIGHDVPFVCQNCFQNMTHRIYPIVDYS